MKRIYLIIFMVTLIVTSGCAAPKIKLFRDGTDPLKEFTLEGKAKEKILLIPIHGVISDAPKKAFLQPRPSMVQEIVSQLQKAEKDKNIRAILLKVNSPGGTATASDILYKEFLTYKNRTKAKVIVVMMDVAASGGYYLSLPADHIVAHPTTITGSVGAVFIYPKLTGLMEKIGLKVEVNKSGKNKDMGSPFRESTREERELLQKLTDSIGKRFLNLTAQHRNLNSNEINTVSTARVFSAKEALDLKLIDEIGYLTDGIRKTKTLSNLPEDAKVVVYRRTKFPNDNLYNPATTQSGIYRSPIVNIGLLDALSEQQPGIYYLWKPVRQ